MVTVVYMDNAYRFRGFLCGRMRRRGGADVLSPWTEIVPIEIANDKERKLRGRL